MSRSSFPVRQSVHVRKNDEVEVVSGSNKGQKGKVLEVLTKKNRVVIEGVNMIKKASRPTQNNPKGGITEREGSIHASNVKLVKKAEGKPSAAKAEK